VLADVPEITKVQQRDCEIVAATVPLSRVAEAYRAIRSSLLFSRAAMAAAEAGRNDSSRNGSMAGPGRQPLRARARRAARGDDHVGVPE
jgi:hypothetical protein